MTARWMIEAHAIEQLEHARSRNRPPPRLPARDSSGTARWYVAHTSGWPSRARFKDAGFDVFVPLERILVGRAARKRIIEVPLLGAYAFVRLDLSRPSVRSIDPEAYERAAQTLAAVNAVKGVIGLAGFETDMSDVRWPRAVPDDVVDILRELGTFDRVLWDRERRKAALRPGARVRILSGPFADHLATIARLDRKDRIKVLLSAYGGCAPLSISAQHVTPVSAMDNWFPPAGRPTLD